MNECYIILDNLRSVHNVGSIFRTADGVGVTKIFLIGSTPTPIDRFGRKRKDLTKVSLGAEEFVDWESISSSRALVDQLIKEGTHIVAVEQDPRARDYRTHTITGNTAFVFGNEIDGVAPEILGQCDEIIEIPMKGTKESLNVAVSVGVVLFRLCN